jgi:hypothetical protein
MRFKNYLTEGSKTLNVAKVPLDKARKYAEGVFGGAEELDKVIPDFDKNYVALQNLYKKDALDIARINMPVIEPNDMKVFNDRLKKGQIDIFKPHALSKKELFPKNISKKEGEEWVKLGEKDGDPNDDKIPAKITSKSGSALKPLQGQLWLEKLVNNIKKFGAPKAGSPVLETTIIVSKEGYILDGHHRHGQVMLVDPSLKMKALYVPLDVKTLLKMGVTYGTAIGNKAKA